MKQIDYNLLGKILSNEATEKEQVQFSNWLEQSEANREIYEVYRVFYEKTIIAESNPHSFRSKNKDRQPQHFRVNRSKRGVYWAVAASVIFLLFFSVYFFADQFRKTPDTQIVENKIISYSNPKGKKSKIQLPDGSVVWLNSDSKVEYLENFTDSLRKINLAGEAYFEVTRDTARPFIVDVGDLQATVLGTTFNVSNYLENDLVTVSLASGKLLVRQENNNEILLPGNEIKYSKANNRLDRNNIEIGRIAAWKNGLLLFEQEDFQTVITLLQRWYNVEITVYGDPSPEWKFTGYFDNEYLSNVLEALCYGKNLNYKIEGQHVKIIKH